MNKISIIIQREYLTRVKKKSFLIMSLVGPLLLGLIMVVPIWLATLNNELKTISVLDESGLLAQQLQSTSELQFVPVSGPLNRAKANFLKSEDADALLYIPAIDLYQPEGISLFSGSKPSLSTQADIQKLLRQKIEYLRLQKSGIEQAQLNKIKAPVSIHTVSLSAEGEQANNSALNTVIGLVCAVLIYMFIFLYGVQIMRGVIEEKTSRIIEVIISSVRPIQLLAGKIIGIALVALTQLLIWLTLSFAISSALAAKFKPERFADDKIEQTMASTTDVAQAQQMNELMGMIQGLPVGTLLFSFLFYFLGGYLLYGALFAAIGAAVDNETDTQQFMLPVTIPLILSFVIAQGVIMKDPNGTVAFWLSMFPLTSPVVMMVRLPFDVPVWQLLLSMALLLIGFMGTTWLAARIYRVGILMYGKKPSYAELSKWLFYKA